MDQQEFEKALREWLDDSQNAINVSDKRLLRSMFYGDFGSGKTSLVAQIIKAMGWKSMLFYTDSNFAVIQKDPEAAKLIDVKPFQNWTELKTFAHAHRVGMEGFAGYDCLVLDTTSTAVYRILRMLTKIKFEDQRHPELESWSHYNLLRAKTLELIQELNQSNLHIIYTSHQQDPSKNEQEGVIKHFAARPNMPEKTFNIFAGEVSLVGWLSKEDGKPRQVTFEGTLRRMAKSQIPGIEEKSYPVDQIPQLIKTWQTNQ